MTRRIGDYTPLTPTEAQPAVLDTTLRTLATFEGGNSPMGYTGFVFDVAITSLVADTATFYIEYSNDGTNWAGAQGVVAGSATGSQDAGDMAINRANTEAGNQFILQTFTTARALRLRGITSANAGTVTVKGARLP